MMAKAQGRIPPHSLEAEVSVLGAVLLSNKAFDRAAEIVQVDDFYDPRHRVIFAAMNDLASEQRPIDRVTLAEMLVAQEQLKQAGGGTYLAELTLAEPTAAHTEEYARLIRGHAVSRAVIEQATDLVQACYQPGADPKALMADAEQALAELSDQHTTRAAKAMPELIADTNERLEQRKNNKGLVFGTPTGFHDLDKIINGLQETHLLIVAARPSMGKSLFACQTAYNAARSSGKGVLISSLEMDEAQIMDRLLSSCSHFRLTNIRGGYITDSDQPKIDQGLDKLARAKLFIDDTPAVNISHIRLQARKVQREAGLALIVVDYLQLMEAPGRSGNERVTNISRSLKALAKEFKVPVMALSQLNRKVEDRDNKRPTMADLRESGQIEQDADIIIFIYRDEQYYKSESKKPGIADIIVAKYRQGSTGEVELGFNGPMVSFENIDRYHEEPDVPF